MLRASLPLMTAIKPSIESSRRNRGQSSPSTSTPINNTRPHSSLPPSRPSPSSTPNIINTTLSTTQPSAQSINTQPRRSNNRHSSHPIPRSSYNTRSKSRQSHIHSNNSSSSGRGLHTRRSIASAFYAGPAEKDRFVHTAHVRAESSASGFHSPRHIAYLQLSPRGAQPQRHIAIQRRQRQQRQHQQQQQFSLSQHHYRLYQQLQQGQDFYSSKPSTVSPSESVSVVSPLIVPRPSSMPLDYTRSFEKQGQEEAATTMSQWRSQQPRRHPMGLERDRDATLDPSQPDAYLIHERLLDLQELQLHKEKQLEQRQMQAYRIQKFSDSNNIDFDYRGSSIFKESQKEGFESYWGESIGVDKEATELHPGPGDNHERQESGYGLNVAMDNEQRERERKEQRTQQHELELMETDMETEKTGDDDMYEGMEPQIRLEHARWAKEEAIRQYQRAGRSLQRAREREEAIKYEYEVDLFEVGVESSVSQQGHRRQRPGDYILSTFEQLQQHEETRSRHSSPTTTAAAAAAATYQVQDDTNLEAMLSSRVVPQVSDNLSAMSETPRLHLGDISTPQIIKAPPPPEPASGLERPTRMSTPKARDEIQEKDRSRSKSQVRGRAQSEPMENVHTFHYRHASRSPNIKIKSEEFEEAFFRKYPLGNERRDGKGLRRQSPKYQDFDVTIHIPSSIGSEVGRNGQPESSNAQRQGKTARRHPPERWRSPTPAPISIHTKLRESKVNLCSDHMGNQLFGQYFYHLLGLLLLG
ncbi:hypothetical protein FBU30_001509 [Linnemannia zychae]|nr:hypothetical protein FBU30_001509 [Linnemannia zychae]